jgi:DNA-binding Lrp family transcriptional regulator
MKVHKRKKQNSTTVERGKLKLSISASQRIIAILMEDGKMTVGAISSRLGKKNNSFVNRVIRGESVLTFDQVGMLLNQVGVALGAKAVKAIRDVTTDDVMSAVHVAFTSAKREAIGTGRVATKKVLRTFGRMAQIVGAVVEGAGS